VALGVAVLVSGPVAAHSEQGELTVVVAEAPAPGMVRLEVGLVYANDGHLAEESSVTASLTGPGGVTLGPVDLPRIAGARYGTEVPVPTPGTWQVTFAATGPTAQGTATIEVPPVTTSSAPPVSGPPTTTTTTTPATTGDPTVALEEESSSGRGTAIAVAAAVGGSVLLGGITLAVLRSRRTAR